jgi:hypothetical protein
LDWAKYTVEDLLGDANLQQNVVMHWLGESPAPGVGSGMSEMEAAGVQDGAPSVKTLDSLSARLGMQKQLTYQRITIGLTRKRLDGLGLTQIDPDKVRQMDAVDQMGNMQQIGKAIAAEQVHMERLKMFFV